MAALFTTRNECPGCSSADARTLFAAAYLAADVWGLLTSCYPLIAKYRDEFANHEYRAEACTRCSLIFQRELPAAELLAELYGEWLPAHGSPRANPSFQMDLAQPLTTRPGQELHTFARALKRPMNQLRVLDFGMGWGRWAICVGRLGAESYGYDVSAAGCEFAASEGVKIVAPEDFAALAADVVNTDQTLEHVSHPREPMRQLAAAVRPGGIVKITVPQASDMRRRFQVRNFQAPAGTRNSLNPLHPLEHLQCWNAQSLDRLAQEFGLRRRAMPVRAELEYFRTLGPQGLRTPKRLLLACARPAYNRFSRHNLCAWYTKS